ncbi:alpha/beta hydrolase [Actinoplanes sp. NPDC051411]|jgi:pimeloyl-ACP methyl ester carboxylesterase|uniref:alpha/beta fold hydrolase n=1 Tax=Actinoplanes sp. NPDC051411 TaxID=3155522 RepID=UPI00341EC65B
MTELATFVDGPLDAPPLLLIHGTAASSDSWSRLVPLLTPAHRVIRVDLLGCGRSPADGRFDVTDQATSIGGALDRLGISSAVVAGHSSGGAMATELATIRPSLVRGLALINTGPSMDAYIAPAFPFQPSDWPTLTDAQLRTAVAQAFRPGFDVPQDAIDQVRAMTFTAFAATSVALRSYLAERALPARLAAVGKPLLVVFGTEDQRWRASSANDYRAVPGAEVTFLPGVGHTPLVEDPPATAARLLTFAANLKD